jgi:hypothetical protein
MSIYRGWALTGAVLRTNLAPQWVSGAREASKRGEGVDIQRKSPAGLFQDADSDKALFCLGPFRQREPYGHDPCHTG